MKTMTITGGYIKRDQKTLIENLLTRFNLSAKGIKDILPIKKGDSGRIYQLDVLFIDNKNEEQYVTIETEYAIRDFLSNSFSFSSGFFQLPKE